MKHLKTESKLVTLPVEVWNEIRNLGYYIPKQGVEYDSVAAIKKIPFQELVYKLSSSQKVILLYTLLSNLDPKKLTTETIANLAVAADENDMINTANSLAEIFDYLIAKNNNQTTKNTKVDKTYKTTKVDNL